MVHRTSSKTPGIGCYLAMILFMLLGSAIFQYFQKEKVFPENSISYPPPSSVGCKSWNWWRPYMSDLAYVPDQLAFFAYNNLAFYNLAQHKFTSCISIEEDDCMKLSPNGQLLAVTRPSGEIEIRQVSSRSVLATPGFYGERANQLVFSPDSGLLAYQVNDAFYLWDASHPSLPPRKLLSSEARYHHFAFSPDGKLLALADYENIRQWNTWDWTERPALPYPRDFDMIGGLIYLPGNQSLILWNDDGFLLLDPAGNGSELYRWIGYEGPTEYVRAVALSPDGRYFALLGHYYWEGSTSRTGSRWPGSNDFLHLWRTDGWQYLGQIKGNAAALAFSPDSRTLAIDWEGKVHFMPLDELIPTLKIPEE